MNKQKNNHISKSINPFKEDFSESVVTQDNLLSQTYQNINNNKVQNKILDNQLETAFENKINKQYNNKNIKKKRSTICSSKNLSNYRDSLKIIGIEPSKNDEYLTLRKVTKISQQNYDNLKEQIIDQNTLVKLYNTLDNINCNFKSVDCFESVGGLSPLTALIEKSFLMNKDLYKEMINKFNILKNYIYNYRTINKDGNCFYRAIMFRYLEILILEEKIEYFQNLIYDIVNSFQSKELKARLNIKNLDINPDLTFKILILIVDLLKNKMKDKAHQILVKSFCTCKKFDYAIILYFRYILYDFIRKNENKVYLKSFPVKIGNLLPSRFETEDGSFLFNSFYEDYLLKFFTDAEKIIIYLTPFVLLVELDIIIFDDNEDEIIKKLKYEGNSEIKFNNIISLLNKQNHYEIIYTPEDYEKNKQIFSNYENHLKSVVLNEIIKNESNNLKILSNNKSINPKSEINSNKIYKKKISNNGNSNSNSGINNIDDNNINNMKSNNKTKKNIINEKNIVNINNDEKEKINIMDDDNNKINKNESNNNSIKTEKINYIKDNIEEYNQNINRNINRNININNYQSSQETNDKDNENMSNNNQLNQNINEEINKKYYTNDTKIENIINKNNNDSNPIKTQGFGLKNPEKESKQHSIPSKSHQNIGFITPGQNKIKNICMICKININNQNINLCKLCLKSKIIEQAYILYLNHLEQFWNEPTELKEKINLKIKNNEEPKLFTFEELINLYNNIDKNEKLTKEEIINECKKKVCIVCHKDINKQSFKLPCNCSICSIGEFNYYLNNYNFNKDFRCSCSQEYNREMMIELGILSNSINLNNRIRINSYFNKKLNHICCICGKTSNILNNIGHIAIIHSFEEDQKNVNNFLSQLEHHFCQNCYYQKIENFDCQVCKIKHIFIPNNQLNY